MSSVEFDPQTHLPKRVSYDTQQAGGAPIYSEDYTMIFATSVGSWSPSRSRSIRVAAGSPIRW